MSIEDRFSEKEDSETNRETVLTVLLLISVSVRTTGFLKNCATNFCERPIGAKIKSCYYLPRITWDMHEMEYFVLFLDPATCNRWEITFSTAMLAASIAEEGITFAKGPLGWSSYLFFTSSTRKIEVSLCSTRINQGTRIFCHVLNR